MRCQEPFDFMSDGLTEVRRHVANERTPQLQFNAQKIVRFRGGSRLFEPKPDEILVGDAACGEFGPYIRKQLKQITPPVHNFMREIPRAVAVKTFQVNGLKTT